MYDTIKYDMSLPIESCSNINTGFVYQADNEYSSDSIELNYTEFSHDRYLGNDRIISDYSSIPITESTSYKALTWQATRQQDQLTDSEDENEFQIIESESRENTYQSEEYNFEKNYLNINDTFNKSQLDDLNINFNRENNRFFENPICFAETTQRKEYNKQLQDFIFLDKKKCDYAMEYMFLSSIKTSVNLSLLVVTSKNIIICEESRALIYKFTGELIHVQELPGFVHYMKVVNGYHSSDILLFGCNSGDVGLIMVDSLFMKLLIKAPSGVSCCDINSTLTRLAVVTDKEILQVYKLSGPTSSSNIENEEPELIFVKNEVTSTAFNTNIRNLYVYSDSTAAYVNVDEHELYYQNIIGYAVGFVDTRIQYFISGAIHSMDIPALPLIQGCVKHKRFVDALGIAKLLSYKAQLYYVGIGSMRELNFKVATRAFLYAQDYQFSKLAREAALTCQDSNLLQNEAKETKILDINASINFKLMRFRYALDLWIVGKNVSAVKKFMSIFKISPEQIEGYMKEVLRRYKQSSQFRTDFKKGVCSNIGLTSITDNTRRSVTIDKSIDLSISGTTMTENKYDSSDSESDCAPGIYSALAAYNSNPCFSTEDVLCKALSNNPPTSVLLEVANAAQRSKSYTLQYHIARVSNDIKTAALLVLRSREPQSLLIATKYLFLDTAKEVQKELGLQLAVSFQQVCFCHWPIPSTLNTELRPTNFRKIYTNIISCENLPKELTLAVEFLFKNTNLSLASELGWKVAAVAETLIYSGNTSEAAQFLESIVPVTLDVGDLRRAAKLYVTAASCFQENMIFGKKQLGQTMGRMMLASHLIRGFFDAPIKDFLALQVNKPINVFQGKNLLPLIFASNSDDSFMNLKEKDSYSVENKCSFNAGSNTLSYDNKLVNLLFKGNLVSKVKNQNIYNVRSFKRDENLNVKYDRFKDNLSNSNIDMNSLLYKFSSEAKIPCSQSNIENLYNIKNLLQEKYISRSSKNKIKNNKKLDKVRDSMNCKKHISKNSNQSNVLLKTNNKVITDIKTKSSTSKNCYITPVIDQFEKNKFGVFLDNTDFNSEVLSLQNSNYKTLLCNKKGNSLKKAPNLFNEIEFKNYSFDNRRGTSLDSSDRISYSNSDNSFTSRLDFYYIYNTIVLNKSSSETNDKNCNIYRVRRSQSYQNDKISSEFKLHDKLKTSTKFRNSYFKNFEHNNKFIENGIYKKISQSDLEDEIYYQDTNKIKTRRYCNYNNGTIFDTKGDSKHNIHEISNKFSYLQSNSTGNSNLSQYNINTLISNDKNEIFTVNNESHSQLNNTKFQKIDFELRPSISESCESKSSMSSSSSSLSLFSDKSSNQINLNNSPCRKPKNEFKQYSNIIRESIIKPIDCTDRLTFNNSILAESKNLISSDQLDQYDIWKIKNKTNLIDTHDRNLDLYTDLSDNFYENISSPEVSKDKSLKDETYTEVFSILQSEYSLDDCNEATSCSSTIISLKAAEKQYKDYSETSISKVSTKESQYSKFKYKNPNLRFQPLPNDLYSSTDDLIDCELDLCDSSIQNNQNSSLLSNRSFRLNTKESDKNVKIIQAGQNISNSERNKNFNELSFLFIDKNVCYTNEEKFMDSNHLQPENSGIPNRDDEFLSIKDNINSDLSMKIRYHKELQNSIALQETNISSVQIEKPYTKPIKENIVFCNEHNMRQCPSYIELSEYDQERNDLSQENQIRSQKSIYHKENNIYSTIESEISDTNSVTNPDLISCNISETETNSINGEIANKNSETSESSCSYIKNIIISNVDRNNTFSTKVNDIDDEHNFSVLHKLKVNKLSSDNFCKEIKTPSNKNVFLKDSKKNEEIGYQRIEVSNINKTDFDNSMRIKMSEKNLPKKNFMTFASSPISNKEEFHNTSTNLNIILNASVYLWNSFVLLNYLGIPLKMFPQVPILIVALKACIALSYIDYAQEILMALSSLALDSSESVTVSKISLMLLSQKECHQPPYSCARCGENLSLLSTIPRILTALLSHREGQNTSDSIEIPEFLGNTLEFCSNCFNPIIRCSQTFTPLNIVMCSDFGVNCVEELCIKVNVSPMESLKLSTQIISSSNDHAIIGPQCANRAQYATFLASIPTIAIPKGMKILNYPTGTLAIAPDIFTCQLCGSWINSNEEYAGADTNYYCGNGWLSQCHLCGTGVLNISKYLQNKA